ncbi:MAG: hypothetical protein NTV06_05545 [candidate division Zixibacteria bacterium]|nr:hypothetical protein [candidate division Zixibacteria bacterium]
MLLIKFTGIGWLDPLIALGVAVVIGHAAYGIVKRSIKDLMDEELSEKDATIVEKVLQEHHPYFVGFHNLRSRKSGNQREIDLHLVQCRHVNLQDAHLVCDHLEQELRAKIPTVNITIHVEPCEDDCINSKDKCKVDIGKLASHISDDPSFTGKEKYSKFGVPPLGCPHQALINLR